MPRTSVDYEEDFYAWTIEQSRLLRAGELSEIDIANIAEERTHLLKWRHQPGARSKSWSATIDEQQLQIEEVLAERSA